jgi:cobalamin-dependent methionine synthase I
MLVIADNLSVRNKAYMDAVKKKDRKAIEAMAKELASKGAELINVQVSLDGVGDEDALPMATESVQQAAGLPLCLDSRNVQALRKAVPLCKEPPIINYLSADEKNPDEFFALVRETKSNLIIRALKGTVPTTLEAKLMIIEDLMEKANAADIPNERIFAHECIIVLNEMVDPPVNTAVWISNVTTGLPKNLKSTVASAYLCYLAGAGLHAAMVNVKDPEIMKAVYLIKSFRDEIIFSPADLA